MKQSTTRRNSLLLSALAVVVSAALLGGGTYALFSQQESYSIEVSTGDIKVTGGLAITSAWSQGENASERENGTAQADGSYVVAQGGVFSTDGAKIVMNNMSQGDGASYTLSLANESTVNMQYRVYLQSKEDNALTKALKVTVDGTECAAGEGTTSLVG